MSEQLKIVEKKPIAVCGFRQNCYRIGTSGGPAVATAPIQPKIKGYTSLEKKTLPNGYVQELTIKDYPINSASVSSYADGADYRNDPAQAVENVRKRVNLGDITQVQAFMDNPQNNARIYKDVLNQLVEYYKKQGQPQPAPAPAPDGGDK